MAREETGAEDNDGSTIRQRNRRLIPHGCRLAESGNRARRAKEIGRTGRVLGDTRKRLNHGETAARAEVKEESAREKTLKAFIASLPSTTLRQSLRLPAVPDIYFAQPAVEWGGHEILSDLRGARKR